MCNKSASVTKQKPCPQCRLAEIHKDLVALAIDTSDSFPVFSESVVGVALNISELSAMAPSVECQG